MMSEDTVREIATGWQSSPHFPLRLWLIERVSTRRVLLLFSNSFGSCCWTFHLQDCINTDFGGFRAPDARGCAVTSDKLEKIFPSKGKQLRFSIFFRFCWWWIQRERCSSFNTFFPHNRWWQKVVKKVAMDGTQCGCSTVQLKCPSDSWLIEQSCLKGKSADFDEDQGL